ncbi:MAG: hypothetical protein NZ960_01060 [Candidatus Kapabacteria bacterium]|nr:hypothetical protein [Candidatus Kapabacteria bacterium]MDW8011616.1 hypothetical protein [Bacteroidota bacterium]
MRELPFVVWVASFVLAVAVKAQSVVEVTAGLATTWLVGNNPARTAIIVRDTAQSSLGSGFSGVQPGISLTLLHPFAADWRIGVGVEQTYFEGLQRFRLRVIDVYLRYAQTVTSVAGFLEWMPVRFPLARGYGFISVEPRWTIVSRGRYTYEQVDTRQGRVVDRLDTLIHKPPEPVYRFGLFGRIGIGGELEGAWHFRANVGIGVLNLLGRRPERGELLTPVNFGERTESYAVAIVSALLLQYHLRVP